MAEKKIQTISELEKKCGVLRKAGKRIVSTNGVFDLLHVGHIRYLQKARGMGDILVVGVNSDESVANLKGKGRPLVPQAQRAEVLAALEAVSFVCIFAQSAPMEFLEAVKPNIHVKGGDYARESLPEKALVERHGGKIEIIPFEKGYSTTALIERILRTQGK